MLLARRLAAAGLWLLLAALFALGAAGLVTGFGAYPGTPERAELTWATDRAVEPGLTAAASELEALVDGLDALGLSARTALAALVATDIDRLQSSVDEGTLQVDAVTADSAALRTTLARLPGVDPGADDLLANDAELRYGPETRDRIAAFSGVVTSTNRLPLDWTRFSGSSLAAQRLTVLLQDHDTSTASAATLGRGGDYAGAQAALDRSDALMDQASALRDILADSVDVSTLNEWLSRNGDYDEALRQLYSALDASDGRVTDEVRAAFEAEQESRERLPPDTRGLVIILAEIARGGMNEIAIGIELARAQLDDALAAARGEPADPADGSPSPVRTAEPSPSPSPS